MLNTNRTLKSAVKELLKPSSHFTGALPNPPGDSREVPEASRNIQNPSCELTGAPLDIRNPSGELTGASLDIQNLNPELGTVPRSVRNCVRQLGCEPPDTLWHNPELAIAILNIQKRNLEEGIAVLDIQKRNREEGIAVLWIFIHISHLGIVFRQTTQASRRRPTAPLHHPDTCPPGRLSVQQVQEATWQDKWQPASSPLPAGEGRGEGENIRRLAAQVSTETSHPFSLTPALSRWERETGSPLSVFACASRPSSTSSSVAPTRLASPPLPAGEGRGEGENIRRLAAQVSTETSHPFSLTPALSRWEREPRTPSSATGVALRTIRFAFCHLPFAFPACIPP